MGATERGWGAASEMLDSSASRLKSLSSGMASRSTWRHSDRRGSVWSSPGVWWMVRIGLEAGGWGGWVFDAMQGTCGSWQVFTAHEV